MKRFLLPLFSCMLFIKGQSQNNVDSFPEYKGKDLGLTYSTKKSSIRVSAPTAEMVQLNVYDNSKLSPGVKTIAMDRSPQGTWTATLKGDQLGKYYTFNIKYKGAWLDEVPDPYAKAVGTNGKQAMIVDLAKTNPNGWNKDRSPMLKNTTEGSYASSTKDGSVRIKEFKQLVKAFHDKGLSVVMDVVFNHTGLTEHSSFNQLVPGYYYRHTADGKLSNATACGNETASEKAMMRKFMLESVLYWAKEYHIDGFRFDLMGVHDIETMNLISRELHKIKPGIIIYGEGWTAGSSPLPDSLRVLKQNASKLDRIAVFSDDIRDGIKGSVFDAADRGFATGKPGMEESIKFGIVASCQHPQVDYSKVNYSKAPYANYHGNTITYAECHDNNTL